MRLHLVILVLFSFSEPSSGFFPRRGEDKVTAFQKDAAKALQSGKEAGKEKLTKAKQSLDKVSVVAQQRGKVVAQQAKEKGKIVAQEGKGMYKDAKTRLERVAANEEPKGIFRKAEAKIRRTLGERRTGRTKV